MSKLQITLLVLGGLLLLACVSYTAYQLFFKEPEPVSVISKSSLMEVVQVRELTSIEYQYNSVATVRDAGEDKYHVAYEGTVRMGIDFDGLEAEIGEETGEIVIKVPKVRVQDCIVDMGTLDFIFEKDKYETESVISEAYPYCLSDLKEKVEKDSALFLQAQENVEAVILRLTQPWVQEVGEGYTVRIERKEDEG